jgi:hypothetical protein
MPNQSPWIWQDGKAEPLPNVLTFDSTDVTQTELSYVDGARSNIQAQIDNLAGAGSVKYAELTYYPSGQTKRVTGFCTPYIINSAPNDGSVLAGTTATGSGSGGVLGGTAPALAGTGGTLAGAVAGGTGAVPTGTGATPTDVGGGYEIENTHEIRIAADFGFEAPTTSVTATVQSTDLAGDFHNVTVTDGSADVRLTKAPDETLTLLADSDQNADAITSRPVKLKLTSTGLTVRKLCKIDGFQTPVLRTIKPVLSNGHYYLYSDNAVNRIKLFKVNASNYNMMQVSNLRNNQYATDAAISVLSLAATGNTVFFAGTAANDTAIKLFQIDTTTDTITLCSNTSNNATTTDLTQTAYPWLTRCGSGFFFWSNNSNNVAKLYYVTDAGSVSQISNTRNNQGITDFAFGLDSLTNNSMDDVNCNAGIVVGAKLYFVANNSSGQAKLFVCDTASAFAVTQVTNTSNNQAVADLGPGVFSFVVVGSKLYISAVNSNVVAKIYEINTSTDVCTQISNLRNNQSLVDINTAQVKYFVSGTDVFFPGLNSSGVAKIFRLDTNTNAFDVASNTRNNTTQADLTTVRNIFGIKNSKLFFAGFNDSGGLIKLYAMSVSTFATELIGNISGVASISDATESVEDKSQTIVVNRALQNSNWFIFRATNNLVSRLYGVNTTDNSITCIASTPGSLSLGYAAAYGERLFLSLSIDNVARFYELIPQEGRLRRAFTFNREQPLATDFALSGSFVVDGFGLFFKSTRESFINGKIEADGSSFMIY